MPMMTILKVCPGRVPEVITIPHTLHEMQKVVNGNIQAIYPFEDYVALVCNEDGKLLSLEPNRAVRDSDTREIIDVICGTFFVCGLTEDDFCSLTNQQMDCYTKMFRCPELFLWNGNQLVVLPMKI